MYLKLRFDVHRGVCVQPTEVCVPIFFCRTAGAFLYRLRSPYFFAGRTINCFSSSVPDLGPFIDIINNALRASFFIVLRLFVFIFYIALPPLSGHALLTGMIYAIFDIELIIGYSSVLVVAQIFFSAISVAVYFGFNLFRARFSFSANHFFLIATNLNLKLSHSSINYFFFSSSFSKQCLLRMSTSLQP